MQCFGFSGLVATIDEQRISDCEYENIAGRAAVVSEKLHFRCDRVSQTRVVRYQLKDTAETVTLYIDICVAMFWVFGFACSLGRMLASWFRPVSFAPKYRISHKTFYTGLLSLTIVAPNDRFYVGYIVFLISITFCHSPCCADPFFVIVQIPACFACAGFCCASLSKYMRILRLLVLCLQISACTGRISFINERVTLYVHICVCVVAGLVACSHADFAGTDLSFFL